MAVTGNRRIEVWVPSKVYDAIGGKGSLGFCANDAERVLSVLSYKEASAGYKQRIGKKVNAEPFREAMDVLRSNIAQLRASGVTGPIPLCAYPATGKRHGTREDRFMRRGTAIHERYHAAVRATEAEFGQKYMGACMVAGQDAILRKNHRNDLDAAWNVSRGAGWARNLDANLEEILARVEEIRQSCNRNVEDCDDINRIMAAQQLIVSDRSKGRTAPDACLFQRLATNITKDFGGALSIPRQAARQCAGVAKPEPRKRNKAKR
jgi:hypothetical protein